MRIAAVACASAVLACLTGPVPVFAQTVKVTPLGSHAGELCDRDCATIFEDPTGVRILYDAGHSVTGGDDPRLGGTRLFKAPGATQGVEITVVYASHANNVPSAC